jgi:hypothetical protein
MCVGTALSVERRAVDVRGTGVAVAVAVAVAIVGVVCGVEEYGEKRDSMNGRKKS